MCAQSFTRAEMDSESARYHTAAHARNPRRQSLPVRSAPRRPRGAHRTTKSDMPPRLRALNEQPRRSDQGWEGIRANSCACYCRYKLDHRLVGNSGGVISESSMQNITRNSLLLRITGIETVDEHICINEKGHDRKGPLSSNRGLRVGLRAGASCGMQHSAFPGGPSPAQKVGAVAGAWQRPPCGMRTANVLPPVSSPRPVTSPTHLRGESRIGR